MDLMRSRGRGPDAHTEFGRLSLSFHRVDIPSLSDALLNRLNYEAGQLLTVARATRSETNIDMACEHFKNVRGEMNKRGL